MSEATRYSPEGREDGGIGMQTLWGYCVVFCGAGLGGALRHAANRLAVTVGAAIPLSTFAVNVTGCLAMGLLVGWLTFRGDTGQTSQLFLATGVLGGYTTFSAFSLDAVMLWQRGQAWAAAAYVAASVLLAIMGVAFGLVSMRP